MDPNKPRDNRFNASFERRLCYKQLAGPRQYDTEGFAGKSGRVGRY